MNAMVSPPSIRNELAAAAAHGVASGDLLTPMEIDRQLATFREHFSPAVLQQIDGEPLLYLMHGRQDRESRCLTYWLEFKNDEEFAGNRFGGIGGGSALKFGIFQRQNDGAWITGSPIAQKVLSLDDAIAIAREQRDELLAGSRALAALDSTDTSDTAYARLQLAMEQGAPKLADAGWAHKYWFLIHSDRLDDYHSPQYQRFHLLKLQQMPPDEVGILKSNAPRFLCAGRFVALARDLHLPTTSLLRILNQRDGAFHRYWKVGTTEGDTGESHWEEMRERGFVSIGWKNQVPDLTQTIGMERAASKEQIRGWLAAVYPQSAAVATRKAGEILNFAQTIAEKDLVLACDGQTVLGIGRISGPYRYDASADFPHQRPVDWQLLDQWRMPEPEGPRTTVYELGRSAANLLEAEQRRAGGAPPHPPQRAQTMQLPPLDEWTARVDAILRRKGQVVLYGPPGTGKTFRALAVARELAAREAFQKTFAGLSQSEAAALTGDAGLVRMCTFHPGWGYENFIEGLQPSAPQGQMLFTLQPGIFKRICNEAAVQSDRRFFLIIDEINRGDLPRIFGELITIIEYDKRGTPINLPLSGQSFSVPRNIFLIGTMNTADRSISLMDTALRRRFGFVELMPDSSMLRGGHAGALLLGPWLDALNARVRRNLKRDARNLQIGHAYLQTKPPITSMVEFARVLRDDIIPLLEEYCYDDFGTLKDILTPELVDSDAGRIREEMFDANREGDLLQAITFPEMQDFVLTSAALDESVTDEILSGATEDGEADSESAPAP